LLGENGVGLPLVGAQGGVDESDLSRAAVDKQLVDLTMSELLRDLVRRQAEAEQPAVDV